MQTVMWLAGLRGAVAFALALDVPENVQSTFMATTLFICIATVILFGTSTYPTLKYFRLTNIGTVQQEVM